MLSLALAIGSCVLLPSVRAQQANPPEQHVIPSIDGPTLFTTYCAVCHGQAADGRGPMARILKTPVPDLTKIAKRNGGVFPLERVENIIAVPLRDLRQIRNGRFQNARHGPAPIGRLPVTNRAVSHEQCGSIKGRTLMRLVRQVFLLRAQER
jgi:hypothetical protein